MPQIASLTEYSATNAWNLNLNNGNVNNNTKASNTNRVRAVSASLTDYVDSILQSAALDDNNGGYIRGIL